MSIIERVEGGTRHVTVDVTGAQDGDTIVRVGGFYKPGNGADITITLADVTGLQAALDSKMDDADAGTLVPTLSGGTLTPEQLCGHTHPMSEVDGLTASQTAQDAAHTAEVVARGAALAAEANARSSADAANTTAIGNEATARASADGTLTANLTAEGAARVAGDNALAASLAAEATTRGNADTAEASARSAADAALAAAIAAIVIPAQRGARVAVPAIPLLTTVDLAVTWATPMPDATYSIGLSLESGTGLLGQLRAIIKTGTQTAAGFTASLSSGSLVSIGNAFLHAQAIDS